MQLKRSCALGVACLGGAFAADPAHASMPLEVRVVAEMPPPEGEPEIFLWQLDHPVLNASGEASVHSAR